MIIFIFIEERKKETYAYFFGDLLTCQSGSGPSVCGDGGWRLKVEMWNLYAYLLFYQKKEN